MKNIPAIYSEALDELVRENWRFAHGIGYGMRNVYAFEKATGMSNDHSFKTSNFTGRVAYGISKVVVVLDDYDWVIKIPFIDPGNDEQDEIEFHDMIPEESKKFFARNSSHFLWEVDDGGDELVCYLQEKASIDPDQVTEDLISTTDLFSYQNETNNGLDLFTSYYDDDDLRVLEKVVYDYDLYDIHTENVGYNDEGKPIVIDYSFYYI